MTVNENIDTSFEIEDDDPVNTISATHHIERKHNNAGYLAGITATKQKYLQTGFDASYRHGAEMGLEVGYILGVLQAAAVVQSINSRGTDNSDTNWEKTYDFVSSNDLSPKGIFDKQFYEKSPSKLPRALYNPTDLTDSDIDKFVAQNVSFGPVNSHPHVKKWSDQINKQLKMNTIQR